MKRTPLVLLLLMILVFPFTSCFYCHAQGSLRDNLVVYPNNSIFLELGGNSVFYGSLNYERIFLQRDFFYLSGRAGVGFGGFLSVNVLSVPLMANGIFQIYHALAFEVGVGVTLMKISRQQGEDEGGDWSYQYQPAVSAMAGLRVQAKNGFLFRLNFTPFMNYLYEHAADYKPAVWFGMSFGY